MTPITTIKKDFKKVIRYSQGIEDPQVDALFYKWLEAKRDIIEAWGGKYIVETSTSVTFELSDKEKQNRVNEFINAVDDMYHNNELVEFLDWLTHNEVFKNHLERDYHYGSDKKITKGTKVVKALKHFESNERALRNIQDQLSMIIQEDKITGTLCFSVHPLDFLSSSENTYHWRSCHALDGDYRSGNLSYMMDKSTIICYLRKADELKRLPNFPEDVLWNSKKWRMLLYLSDDWNAMFAGRQYPFFSPNALDLVQMFLLRSLGKNSTYWSPWYNDYIDTFPRKKTINLSDSNLHDRIICMGGRLYGMKELVKDCKNPLHFNDLLKSSCYIPYYSWNRYKADNLKFHIGESVPCLHCNGGDNLSYTSSMMCNPCEITFGEGEDDYFAYCGCCERRAYRDDMYYVRGLDDLVCPDCFNREVKECDCCGEYWYTSDIEYNHTRNQYMCPGCRAYFERNPNADSITTSCAIDWDEDLPF